MCRGALMRRTIVGRSARAPRRKFCLSPGAPSLAWVTNPKHLLVCFSDVFTTQEGETRTSQVGVVGEHPQIFTMPWRLRLAGARWGACVFVRTLCALL